MGDHILFVYICIVGVGISVITNKKKRVIKYLLRMMVMITKRRKE